MKNFTSAEIREWLVGMTIMGILIGMWSALYVIN